MNLTRRLDGFLPAAVEERRYLLATFVRTLAYGMVLPAVTIYFTQVVELSPVEVGLGFTVAGLIGLLVGPAAGRLADRRGPKEVVVVTAVLQGIGALAYLLIDDFPTFLVVTALEACMTTANVAASGALTRRVGGEDAVSFRSRIRMVMNLGVGLGVVLAAIPLQVGSPTGYRTVLATQGIAFFVSALVLSRLPHYAPLEEGEGTGRWMALSDKPFIAYSLASGLLSVQYFVLDLALPLWVVTRTDAPPWSISLFILVNTVLVTALMIRVGKRVQTTRQGGGAMRIAGLLFLVSCCGLALSDGMSSLAALALLTFAILVHSVGELLYASGSFALDVGLAPAEHQGQYQGVSGVGMGIGAALAPIILVGWVIERGPVGWVALGAGLLVLGLLVDLASRWAGDRAPVTEESAASAADPAVDEEPAR